MQITRNFSSLSWEKACNPSSRVKPETERTFSTSSCVNLSSKSNRRTGELNDPKVRRGIRNKNPQDNYLMNWASMCLRRRQCFAIDSSTSVGHLHKSIRRISERLEAARSRLAHVSSGVVTKSIFFISRCCVPARRKWLANRVQS